MLRPAAETMTSSARTITTATRIFSQSQSAVGDLSALDQVISTSRCEPDVPVLSHNHVAHSAPGCAGTKEALYLVGWDQRTHAISADHAKELAALAGFCCHLLGSPLPVSANGGNAIHNWMPLASLLGLDPCEAGPTQRGWTGPDPLLCLPLTLFYATAARSCQTLQRSITSILLGVARRTARPVGPTPWCPASTVGQTFP
jgi:hypothetical protein